MQKRNPGRPPSADPKTVTVSVRLTADEAAELQTRALAHGERLSDVARRAMALAPQIGRHS